jgi:hypothetical protein
MKKILIISPHYPPSNLAAVHRSRLFALHLPLLGWDPIILSVDEKDYEEDLDWNLHALLPKEQRIEKVRAFPITKPRLIGDIGLRAYFQLRQKALDLVIKENIDFVYIPIPSFYVSLIGTYLNRKTGVKFGIDYIDPWVHQFPGSEKIFTRHWFSTQLAKYLEPKAIKNVSLITGVAEGYYQGVISRNPNLLNSCVFGAMPYGGEKQDNQAVKTLGLTPYLFQRNEKMQLVYAGAMLPKAYEPLEIIFKQISKKKMEFLDIEFHFIGTGYDSNDSKSFNIKALAKKYNLWKEIVFEYPKRIPYLDVLIHLDLADAIFILGSTEAHYTPSKTYQAVISEKPIFAVLHQESQAASVIQDTNAGIVIKFNGREGVDLIESQFQNAFSSFRLFKENYNPINVDQRQFDLYSAKSVTNQLANILDKLVV